MQKQMLSFIIGATLLWAHPAVSMESEVIRWHIPSKAMQVEQQETKFTLRILYKNKTFNYKFDVPYHNNTNDPQFDTVAFSLALEPYGHIGNLTLQHRQPSTPASIMQALYQKRTTIEIVSNSFLEEMEIVLNPLSEDLKKFPMYNKGCKYSPDKKEDASLKFTVSQGTILNLTIGFTERKGFRYSLRDAKEENEWRRKDLETCINLKKLYSANSKYFKEDGVSFEKCIPKLKDLVWLSAEEKESLVQFLKASDRTKFNVFVPALTDLETLQQSYKDEAAKLGIETENEGGCSVQ
jgi:hypothetical protein